jgi:DNA-binding MarR family transcriptional regulator
MQADPDSLVSTALQFVRAVRSRHSALLAEHGLHPGQDGLFLAIWQQPGMRMSVLAEELDVERPTVTRMVARLERSGLVERRRDPDDGRVWLVFPTQRSRLLEASVRRARAELEESLSVALESQLGTEPIAKTLQRAADHLRNQER